MTVVSYVTVTYTPLVVTIAVPDSAKISKSLASASMIDSIVVVEQSQDRPISNQPDFSVPTFINTIKASAFEATEIAPSGISPVYTPVGTDATHTPISEVDIGLTTISVKLPNAGTISTSPAAVSSTHVPPVFASNSNDNSQTTSSISYDTTVTIIVTATMPPVLAVSPSAVFPSLMSWPTGSAVHVKRQTCVLVSGDVGNHQTATWCNNWDGTGTLTYTTWATTGESTNMRVPQPSTNLSIRSHTRPNTGDFLQLVYAISIYGHVCFSNRVYYYCASFFLVFHLCKSCCLKLWSNR